MAQEADQPVSTLEGFEQLCRSANSGDREALARLRAALDERPDIWQRLGDLAQHAEMMLIRLIAEGDRLLSESIERKLADLRRDLIRPGAGKIEQLAVERTVATWLQLQHAQTQLAISPPGSMASRDWRQRVAVADRSFVNASKWLGTLQRLTPIAKPGVGSCKPSPVSSPLCVEEAEGLRVFPDRRTA